MSFRTTLQYLKKKDASSVVVAVLLGLSLVNLVQIGGSVGNQLSSLFFAAVDGTWTSLGNYFGRSFFQQVISNLLVTIGMVVMLELVLRAWVWYKAKN